MKAIVMTTKGSIAAEAVKNQITSGGFLNNGYAALRNFQFAVIEASTMDASALDLSAITDSPVAVVFLPQASDVVSLGFEYKLHLKTKTFGVTTEPYFVEMSDEDLDMFEEHNEGEEGAISAEDAEDTLLHIVLEHMMFQIKVA